MAAHEANNVSISMHYSHRNLKHQYARRKFRYERTIHPGLKNMGVPRKAPPKPELLHGEHGSAASEFRAPQHVSKVS